VYVADRDYRGTDNAVFMPFDGFGGSPVIFYFDVESVSVPDP